MTNRPIHPAFSGPLSPAIAGSRGLGPTRECLWNGDSVKVRSGVASRLRTRSRSPVGDPLPEPDSIRIDRAGSNRPRTPVRLSRHWHMGRERRSHGDIRSGCCESQRQYRARCVNRSLCRIRLWFVSTDEFFRAAKVAEVVCCLNAGADPNARTEDGVTVPALGGGLQREPRNHRRSRRRGRRPQPPRPRSALLRCTPQRPSARPRDHRCSC